MRWEVSAENSMGEAFGRTVQALTVGPECPSDSMRVLTPMKYFLARESMSPPNTEVREIATSTSEYSQSASDVPTGPSMYVGDDSPFLLPIVPTIAQGSKPEDRKRLIVLTPSRVIDFLPQQNPEQEEVSGAKYLSLLP